MGLSQVGAGGVSFKEEEKELQRMGIRATSIVTPSLGTHGNLKKTLDIADEAYRGIAKIVTEGFDNGMLVHNMPCPVCLKNPAVYVNTGKDTYFAPCPECAKKGFVLKKKRWLFF